jgi:preprotein translocase subunit SecF
MTATSTTPTEPAQGGVRRFLARSSNYDFVGRSRTWLWVSLGILGVCLLGILVRQLNFGIDFTGGAAYVVSGATNDFTADELRAAVAEAGVSESVVQITEDEGGRGARISTPALEEIGGAQQDAVVAGIVGVTGAPEDSIEVTAVGPRWGEQISRQGLRGLLVFLVLVVLYISLRFEWRMALAALVTLLHDVLITIGVYAIVGFEVTPASVIALLTILGYSLYDTVVVFDRVRENTAGLTSVSTQTYGEVANASLNQVLVRSLSTSMTALLPVGALLFIGANLLGGETLRDLALALFVGMGVGTYSSIFVATPFLVFLKEREPRYAELRERVDVRRREPRPAAVRPTARKTVGGKPGDVRGSSADVGESTATTGSGSPEQGTAKSGTAKSGATRSGANKSGANKSSPPGRGRQPARRKRR